MKFPSMLRTLRNIQGGMGSTSLSPSSNCSYLPSMTEPPWLTEARRYLVSSNFSTYRGELPTSDDNEDTPGGRIGLRVGQRLFWVLTWTIWPTM